MRNIEDFERGCALILARLYGTFPVPVTLRVADLDDGSDLLPEEREVRLAERRLVYGATVQFLSDEGFIVYGNSVGLPGMGAFSQARLTAKGLAQLSRLPAALQPPGKTLGERLADWARAAAADASKEALAALVRQALGG
jgi:hypothetical protein